MQLTTVVIVACKTGEPVVSESLWFWPHWMHALSWSYYLSTYSPNCYHSQPHVCWLSSNKSCRGEWLIKPVLGDEFFESLIFVWGIIKKTDFVWWDFLICLGANLLYNTSKVSLKMKSDKLLHKGGQRRSETKSLHLISKMKNMVKLAWIDGAGCKNLSDNHQSSKNFIVSYFQIIFLCNFFA